MRRCIQFVCLIVALAGAASAQMKMSVEKLVTFVGSTDERSKVVQLTSKGRKALETALPLWHGVQKRMKSTLGAEKDAVFRVLSIMEAEMRSER